jgi:hypothetical protein
MPGGALGGTLVGSGGGGAAGWGGGAYAGGVPMSVSSCLTAEVLGVGAGACSGGVGDAKFIEPGRVFQPIAK